MGRFLLRPSDVLCTSHRWILFTVASTFTVALSACGAPPASARPSAASAPHVVARSKQLLPPWTSSSTARPEASGAGRRVLETATRMVDEGIVVRGSCYRYIDTVYDTAGYSGWRRRTTVFRGNRNGPYANLDLIQPGDWLWIVNHPEADPVGTHSVLFVAWEDRSAGYARVISYVGGAADRPADEVPYDVSRTYAIQRAVDAEEPPRRSRQRRRSR